MATREELVAVAMAHAAAEAEGDMETTMATLEDDCVYEFQPSRRVLRGKEMAERYYEYFFNNTNMTIESYDMRNEWITDDGVGQEYVIEVTLADGTHREPSTSSASSPSARRSCRASASTRATSSSTSSSAPSDESRPRRLAPDEAGATRQACCMRPARRVVRPRSDAALFHMDK